MRIASFNIENCFDRPKAMNLEKWADGKPILDEYSKLNSLLMKTTYSVVDKGKILSSMEKLGILNSDESEWVILRKNRGNLIKRPRNGDPTIVADGRDSWIGWLELKTEAVDEVATRMTAKVVKDVHADILAVIEVESRNALTKFNNQLLKPIQATYEHVMLIDGNDERGIDVGLLCRNGCTIDSIVSHVDDAIDGQTIFSRDCPEYTVHVSESENILFLVNHFKSKGSGTQASSNARRKRQAQRVREIYDQRIDQGIENIIVLGDFNDTPDSDPLSPLLGNGSTLKDITEHSNFSSDGRPGTYANGTTSGKIDYLLLSPDLYSRVTNGGIFRKGVWGGTHGTLFPHYPEMTKPEHAASDHAAIWAEIDL